MLRHVPNVLSRFAQYIRLAHLPRDLHTVHKAAGVDYVVVGRRRTILELNDAKSRNGLLETSDPRVQVGAIPTLDGSVTGLGPSKSGGGWSVGLRTL